MADYPAVVARWNMEEVSRLHFDHSSIVHRRRRPSGKDDADVLHFATCLAKRLANMVRPLPTRGIGSPADGEAADVNKFKLAIFEMSDFVGCIECFENYLQHCLPRFLLVLPTGSMNCLGQTSKLELQFAVSAVLHGDACRHLRFPPDVERPPEEPEHVDTRGL